MLSFVFHFDIKWKTKYISFFVFHFHEGIGKRIVKQTKINFMIISTSLIYRLFKTKFVSSLLRFPSVQESHGHKASAV